MLRHVRVAGVSVSWGSRGIRHYLNHALKLPAERRNSQNTSTNGWRDTLFPSLIIYHRHLVILAHLTYLPPHSKSHGRVRDGRSFYSTSLLLLCQSDLQYLPPLGFRVKWRSRAAASTADSLYPSDEDAANGAGEPCRLDSPACPPMRGPAIE